MKRVSYQLVQNCNTDPPQTYTFIKWKNLSQILAQTVRNAINQLTLTYNLNDVLRDKDKILSGALSFDANSLRTVKLHIQNSSRK